MIQRVLICAAKAAVTERLQAAIHGLDATVEVLPKAAITWTRLAASDADLIVVERSLIPSPATESIRFLRQNVDAPDIVVVVEDDQTEERARLRAAGAEATITAELAVEVLHDFFRTIFDRRRTLSSNRLNSRRTSEPRLSDFVSKSPAMQTFMEVVRRVVETDASILVLGETGVGKERLARAIHADSRLSRGPFVAVNCSAIPESLLESELFGHTEGAFTGATRARRGWIELAQGGTLFLDEIGEMDLHLQVKLLRALQEREIQPVGSEKTIKVDVRIMAASNRDLAAEVEAGRFRRDLYYRLGVITLTIPALRDRKDDIPALARSYIDHFRAMIGRGVTAIDPAAMAALIDYRWPGNIRELMNVIERALLLCDGPTISLADLPEGIARRVAAPQSRAADHEAARSLEGWLESHGLEQLSWSLARQAALEGVERLYLRAVLAEHGGSIKKSAAHAGIDPRSLRQKMRHHGLVKESFKSRQ